MASQGSQSTPDWLSRVDLEEDSSTDVLVHLLAELGYNSNSSYIPNAAINSIWAYLHGEFLYPPKDEDEWDREELMVLIGSEIDEYEFPSFPKFTAPQRRKIAKLVKESEDNRQWL